MHSVSVDVDEGLVRRNLYLLPAGALTTTFKSLQNINWRVEIKKQIACSWIDFNVVLIADWLTTIPSGDST